MIKIGTRLWAIGYREKLLSKNESQNMKTR